MSVIGIFASKSLRYIFLYSIDLHENSILRTFYHMLLFDQSPLFYIFFRGLLFQLWCDVKLSCSRKNCTSTYLYIQLHLFITLINNIWNIFGNPRNTESISRISSGNQNMTVLQRQMLNICAHLLK